MASEKADNGSEQKKREFSAIPRTALSPHLPGREITMGALKLFNAIAVALHVIRLEQMDEIAGVLGVTNAKRFPATVFATSLVDDPHLRSRILLPHNVRPSTTRVAALKLSQPKSGKRSAKKKTTAAAVEEPDTQ